MVDFKIEGLNSNLTVFTTRPDTLFGATYIGKLHRNILLLILLQQVNIKILLMGILSNLAEIGPRQDGSGKRKDRGLHRQVCH